MDFPGDSVVKNLPANAEEVGLIPGTGRSPGEGNGNPLQYSYLRNLREPGVLQSMEWTVESVHPTMGWTKSQTRLSGVSN